jgi:hypothetical protein
MVPHIIYSVKNVWDKTEMFFTSGDGHCFLFLKTYCEYTLFHDERILGSFAFSCPLINVGFLNSSTSEILCLLFCLRNGTVWLGFSGDFSFVSDLDDANDDSELIPSFISCFEDTLSGWYCLFQNCFFTHINSSHDSFFLIKTLNVLLLSHFYSMVQILA